MTPPPLPYLPARTTAKRRREKNAKSGSRFRAVARSEAGKDGMLVNSSLAGQINARELALSAQNL